MKRRQFLKTSALAGAGAAMAKSGLAQAAAGADAVNVGIIGAGKQGMVLLRDCLKIPGLRFRAVCDIWEFSRRYGSRTLQKYGHEPNVYVDYREMLDKEKDLDAVIVATPDFVHAEHAGACLNAGAHVYCEKEMSNTLENAKAMVVAAADTGKLLQIGHQRRSNPVYLHTLDAIRTENLCGRLTNCYGQWNRPVQDKLTWPERYAIEPATLQKYGYASMDHFRNWRWYRKYSAGPIADLGSHQIDIFSWFYGAEPHALVAVGGKDYYGDREWHEDVMVTYEYKARHAGGTGSARGFYQVLNTSGFGNYYERFQGDQGTVIVSENPKICSYTPEATGTPPGWAVAGEAVNIGAGSMGYPLVDALRKRSDAAATDLADWDKKNVHQLHLENFFKAARANDKSILTCPPEVAYPTAVAVLSAIPAIEAGKKITLTESDYHV